jgi:hypothetical protein
MPTLQNMMKYSPTRTYTHPSAVVFSHPSPFTAKLLDSQYVVDAVQYLVRNHLTSKESHALVPAAATPLASKRALQPPPHQPPR